MSQTVTRAGPGWARAAHIAYIAAAAAAVGNLEWCQREVLPSLFAL